jgi:hypothetical protein
MHMRLPRKGFESILFQIFSQRRLEYAQRP